MRRTREQTESAIIESIALGFNSTRKIARRMQASTAHTTRVILDLIHRDIITRNKINGREYRLELI